MGRRGTEAARTTLSWDGVAAQTEQLYRSVIGKRPLMAAAAVA
jgi:hypothetical protein